jgi:hypothetical protein
MSQILHKIIQPHVKQCSAFDKLRKRLSAMMGTHYKPTAASDSNLAYGGSERTSVSIVE